VFQDEPPRDGTLASLPQVIATPHIAASTKEAQELVGLETAMCIRDFLRSGIVRNAVNFPSVAPEESKRLQPFVVLAERLGAVLAQLGDGRTQALGIRYYGELAIGNNEMLVGATLVGLFSTMLSSTVTMVNARAVAGERGIEVIESRSTRPRNFTSLISVKLHTSSGEHWIEGTVFQNGSPRLVLLEGVEIEAPLEGTLLVIRNNDQPGVIGEVGTILGRHGINIATFALGRGSGGAIGVVNVDLAAPGAAGGADIGENVLAEIRRAPNIRSVSLVRL
jgi:D-3-phosphoglycerate dehydrogenase